MIPFCHCEDPGRQGQLHRLRKSCQALIGNSRGFTLIEVLIALAILAIVAVAFLSALATASTALILGDERTTAESLARTQLEYVKSQNYTAVSNATGEASYGPPIGGIPLGYWIRSLEWQGYQNYPDIDYFYTNSTDILGVAWDSANCTAAYNDTGLQIVTVIIYHEGTAGPVLTTTAYKVE
jgi:prepilin-type N-terminal cleavage/methylation domain-containing protein